MTENNDGLQESQLSLAVRKAFKQLLKNIGREPTLVIESDDSEDSALEETIAAIRLWLFKRR